MTKPTRLAQFIEKHRATVKITELSRRSGYSRPHIYNVANGDSDPTREFMDVMTTVCGDLTNRTLTRDDLFEFKPSRRMPRRKAS